jgi:DNA polymerase-3 subunit delta'
MQLKSQIIITSNADDAIAQLRTMGQSHERFEVIRPEEAKAFSVKDAARSIEKAHIASYENKYIILVADVLSEVVQNKLLKAIEEPPDRTDFILIVASKSTLLPTIRSRLPIVVMDEHEEREPLTLNMVKLDVRSAYAFVQEHKRIDSANAKVLLEEIANAAFASGQYRLDERTLDHLRDSRLALDKGSPPSFVLTGVLLKLLAKKKKAVQ